MTTNRKRSQLALMTVALAACGHLSTPALVDTTAGPPVAGAPREAPSVGAAEGRGSSAESSARSTPPRPANPSRPPSASAMKSAAPRSEAASPPAPSLSSSGDGSYLDDRPSEAERSQPEREERPGLGTVFGETRSSHARDVVFERATDQPFAVAVIHYNDLLGVQAMVSYDRRRGALVDGPVPVRGGLGVSVVDEQGGRLGAHSLGGRVYVVGEAGARYSLIVDNQTDRRFEAVASVDGLDVVDGQPASVARRGYIVEPWSRVTIDGFRRNLDEVAAFRFGAVSASYAANTAAGDRNVGVIGVAFFDQQGAAPWSDEEIEQRRSASPFSDARFARPPR